MSVVTGRRALALAATVAFALFAGWALLARQVPVSEAQDVAGGRDAIVAERPVVQGTGSITVYLPLVMRDYYDVVPVFGVQMYSIDDAHGLQKAVDGGVHWVRYSAFHWDEIEPVHTSPPTYHSYHWEKVDETSLSNAHSHGLQVIAIVQFTPSWAQKYSGSYCGPIRQDSLDEFAQFLTVLVNRYKGAPYYIKYWELGNEPDVAWSATRNGWGCWGEENDPYYGGRYYAEMLKVAYPAIKAADPQAQVLLGGLLLDCDPDNPPSGKTCQAGRFLEGILVGGGGAYFDIANFHAYTYYGGSVGMMGNENWSGAVTAVPEKAAFVKGVLQKYGYGDKLLSNTEAAMLCFTATNDCLETQAMYIPRAYAEAMALGLQSQVYYAMINEGWRHTGLLYPDLSVKPVYRAYDAAASFIGEARYEGEASGYLSVVQGYSFRRSDGGMVDVIWSSDGVSHQIPLPGGASAYDKYGTLLATSGNVSVGLSPVYVKR